MGFSYFDHISDIGIIAEAEVIERAFEEGAQAMFRLISDSALDSGIEVSVRLEEKDIVSLWIHFLNSLLLEMDMKGLFFSVCHVDKIVNDSEGCYLEARAKGVARDERQGLHEIKAATYCEADVSKIDDRWRVQCVLDV